MNYDEALTYLNIAVSKYPKSHDLLFLRAQVNFSLQNYNSSLIDISKNIDIIKSNYNTELTEIDRKLLLSLLLYKRGEVFLSLGDTIEAANDFTVVHSMGYKDINDPNILRYSKKTFK